MDAPFAATAQVAAPAQVSSEVYSEVYSLELSEAIVLPDEMIDIVATNSGINLTPYAAKLGPGRLIVALGANVGAVDLDNLDASLFESNAALAVLHREPEGNAWTASGILELGQVSEGIQQIRDLQVFDGRVLISNVRVADGCIALELWSIAFDESPLVLTDPELLFTSSPALCGGRRSVHQSGGRIAVDGGGQVLLTVGDFGLGPSSIAEETGFEGRPEEMEPPNSYGMTHRIKPDGSSEIVSVGHRNQQGLHIDQVTGDVWLSEHGPRAGGEVNLIVEGNDYGWPDVTYGLPYGQELPAGGWDIGRWGGRHEGFTQPVFSWMPSIAPSQLIVYRGEEFTAWDGDLIVSTLRDQSLRRLRMAEGRVVFDERIEIGERIRDMVLLDDGKILLAFDGGYGGRGDVLKILRLQRSP